MLCSQGHILCRLQNSGQPGYRTLTHQKHRSLQGGTAADRTASRLDLTLILPVWADAQALTNPIPSQAVGIPRSHHFGEGLLLLRRLLYYLW